MHMTCLLLNHIGCQTLEPIADLEIAGLPVLPALGDSGIPSPRIHLAGFWVIL